MCEDFGDVGALLVGSAVPGDRAVVGVNGDTLFVNVAEIRGDMNIAGNLTGVGSLDVDGTLRVGGNTQFLGLANVANREPFDTAGGPPCGCDPGTFFDVGEAVAEAAADNDNAAAGLSTDIANVGVRELTLSTGRYYFADADQVGVSRITIDGAVAIYIDGSLDSVGTDILELLPGSSLDLFVSGSVRSVGNLRLGSSQDPSAFNLYVGGSERMTVSVGLAILNATIYAPTVDLHYVGATKIRGAVFANRIVGVGLLTVGYAAPVLPPDLCQPPDDGGDPPDGDPPGEQPPLVL